MVGWGCIWGMEELERSQSTLKNHTEFNWYLSIPQTPLSCAIKGLESSFLTHLLYVQVCTYCTRQCIRRLRETLQQVIMTVLHRVFTSVAQQKVGTTPPVSPVTSGCSIWKTLEDGKVDVYFAGKNNISNKEGIYRWFAVAMERQRQCRLGKVSMKSSSVWYDVWLECTVNWRKKPEARVTLCQQVEILADWTHLTLFIFLMLHSCSSYSSVLPECPLLVLYLYLSFT